MKTKQQIGIIGLGSMGGNIARTLHNNGYQLVLYNKTEEAYAPFKGKKDVSISSDLKDFGIKLGRSSGSSIVWMMIPGGAVTNETVRQLSTLLRKNDIVIDASNSVYTESIANYETLKKKGIRYLDVGCAGGPNDLLEGVSLMVGGDKKAFLQAEDVFRIVSGKGAYGYVGPRGSGHGLKFVHNQIFYGIFPVYAEGIETLEKVIEDGPKSGFDMKEAMRLLQASPPITTGIMSAISTAMKKEIPSVNEQMKVSSMVKWGSERAGQLGVPLVITNGILAGYSKMSDRSRAIFASAKRILTGH